VRATPDRSKLISTLKSAVPLTVPAVAGATGPRRWAGR
jgi:hypothetical protein